MCRFFAVLDNGSALLRVPDIELFGILRIMCEVTDGQQAGRKFDSQKTGITKCKTHTVEDDRSDGMGANQNNVNIRLFQVKC